eukprot:2220997-Alexandrium_andersonii.AAC.1
MDGELPESREKSAPGGVCHDERSTHTHKLVRAHARTYAYARAHARTCTRPHTHVHAHTLKAGECKQS